MYYQQEQRKSGPSQEVIDQQARQEMIQRIKLIPESQNFSIFLDDRIITPKYVPTVKPIQPIKTFSDQYQYSHYHRQITFDLSKEYSHWRKIRGDGNCFYRSIIYAYLQFLLLKQDDSGLIIDFMISIERFLDSQSQAIDTSDILPTERKHIMIKMYYLYLARKKFNSSEAIIYLNKLFLSDLNFDWIMIKILRMRLAEFIVLHQNSIYGEQGLPLGSIIDLQKYQGVIGFVYNELLQMGVEAGDCTLVIAPLIFKINIQIVLVEKLTCSGLIKTIYGSNIDTLQDEVTQTIKPLQSLSFQSQKISIFLKSGHYDLLYAKNYVLSNPVLISSVDKSIQDFLNLHVKKNLKSKPKNQFIKNLNSYSTIPQIQVNAYYDQCLQTQILEQDLIQNSQNQKQILPSQSIGQQRVSQLQVEDKNLIKLSCNHTFKKDQLRKILRSYKQRSKVKFPQSLFYQDPQTNTVSQPICPYYVEQTKIYCQKEITENEIANIFNLNPQSQLGQKLHYIYALNNLIKTLKYCHLCNTEVIFRKMDGIFFQYCDKHLYHVKCVMSAEKYTYQKYPALAFKNIKNSQFKPQLQSTRICKTCGQREKQVVKKVRDKALKIEKKCLIF